MTTSKATSRNEPSPEVPIFLRKTYHMIDSCDPAIAGWSQDGETFVVKQPEKFEKTIIPQFFKHSKFSSFVRQLNFYSFRKIKYADTIRIDPQLEAETANYWRFHHPQFRRGRPDLLSEIKRMNGKNEAVKKATTDKAASTANTAAVESEVQALRARLEEMNKNIDQLTAMVQKVNLKQEEMEHESFVHKRPKVVESTSSVEEESLPSPEPAVSMDVLPELSVSHNMAWDDLANLPPAPLVPLPDPAPLSTKEATSGSMETDVDFVDTLLSNFGDEDDVAFLEEQGTQQHQHNRPDPELMQRLGDALALLPREIQEMIVNRLIDSITSPDFEKKIVLPVTTIPATSESATVPEDEHSTEEAEATTSATPEMDAKQVAVPLAAATLAALLQHFVQHMQPGDKISPKNVSKILPIVPVHA